MFEANSCSISCMHVKVRHPNVTRRNLSGLVLVIYVIHATCLSRTLTDDADKIFADFELRDVQPLPQNNNNTAILLNIV